MVTLSTLYRFSPAAAVGAIMLEVAEVFSLRIIMTRNKEMVVLLRGLRMVLQQVVSPPLIVPQIPSFLPTRTTV
jgi:hypothetical protein